MRFRTLDENGDMKPIRYAEDMLTDADAVGAAVKSRMDLGAGEWWEDESIGFEVPNFLLEGLRGGRDCRMLVNYIIAFIQRTPGVTAITAANYVINNRECTVNLTIETEYGTSVERRLNLYELLSALS